MFGLLFGLHIPALPFVPNAQTSSTMHYYSYGLLSALHRQDSSTIHRRFRDTTSTFPDILHGQKSSTYSTSSLLRHHVRGKIKHILAHRHGITKARKRGDTWDGKDWYWLLYCCRHFLSYYMSWRLFSWYGASLYGMASLFMS